MPPTSRLTARRLACSKGAVLRRIGRTKGGLSSKLHVISDGQGRPLIMLLSEGQMSDHKGAELMVNALPPAHVLIGDKGYKQQPLPSGPDHSRHRTLHSVTPWPKRRIPHDRILYRQRHQIENMFGRIKDWRRIAMRYDRCAHTFMPAICLVTTVLFWLTKS